MMRLDGLFNSQNTQLALINERLDKIETVAMENRKELQELKVDVTTMALNITRLDQRIQSLEELTQGFNDLVNDTNLMSEYVNNHTASLARIKPALQRVCEWVDAQELTPNASQPTDNMALMTHELTSEDEEELEEVKTEIQLLREQINFTKSCA